LITFQQQINVKLILIQVKN